MRQLLPIVLSGTTIMTMWLADRPRPVTWIVALVGQVGWGVFVVLFDAWGLMPLTIILIVIYARNLRNVLRHRTVDDPLVSVRTSEAHELGTAFAQALERGLAEPVRPSDRELE